MPKKSKIIKEIFFKKVSKNTQKFDIYLKLRKNVKKSTIYQK